MPMERLTFGKIKSLSAGRMGLSTSGVGHLVAGARPAGTQQPSTVRDDSR